MAVNYFFRSNIKNNKCVFILLLFFWTYACHINGVNSQNINQQQSDILQNNRKPPDVLNNQLNNVNSVPNLSDSRLSSGRTVTDSNRIKFICRNRLPVFASRRNLPAQTTESPYTILTPSEVIPGQVINVTIHSKNGDSFRGFMLQVLSSDVVIGEFQSPLHQVNLQTCYSNADTATSVGRDSRTSTTVQWKAPEDIQTNTMLVRATIVKNYKTYWADLLSPVISVKVPMQGETKIENNTTPTQVDASPSNTEGIRNNDLENLKTAVANTFESIDGPLESLDEVLTHQGIREVTKVENAGNVDDKAIIHVQNNDVDDELTAPAPAPRYIYRDMNLNPLPFEPPKTSEFLGTLLKVGSSLMGGGNSRAPVPGAVAGGGMGGMGTMMNMMNMLGGGGGGGGGGGMLSSLGTLSKLSGMMGGGGGGGGLPGGLGALSSLSGMLGGGGGAAQAPPPASGGGGLGGLGALSSLGGLLKGFGKKESAPPPVGQPVKPQTTNGEPSLADLLGVDPNTAIVSPTVIPSEVGVGGIAAAKSGGLLSSIGGFAPMLAGIPIAMTLFGGKKKQQQQQPPWGQQGMQGMQGQNGQFGQMPPGANGQFGQMPPGANGQFGQMPPGQFGQMGGANGQFGQMGGANGQFGQMGGANGQFGQMGGANGQFGQMGGANGQFGQMPASNNLFGQSAGLGGLGGTGAFGQTQTSSDTDRIIQLLEQQRMEIEALKNQFSGNSIVNRMGGFGNIPLSLGQPGNILSQGSGLSGLGGSSLSSLTSSLTPSAPSSSANDALLEQLMQQNKMLLQQNQQFNNMITSSVIPSQFGTTSNPFSRVNRSNGLNGQMVDSSMQNQNSLLGQNQFNNAGATMGQFPQAGQNAMGNMNTNNNMMQNGGNAMGGQANGMMNGGGSNMFGGQQGGMNPAASGQGLGGSSMFGAAQSGGGGGGGGSLANMFGGSSGSSGSSSGGMMSGLMGGNSGGGGSNPLAGLMGGGSGGSGGSNPLAGLFGGGGGGGGSGSNPLAGLMGGGGGGSNPLAGLMGGGGGGAGGLDGLMQGVDMNAVQNVLGGKEGQDLMNNMMGMLQGPEGGNLMKAVEGVMSGNTDPGQLQQLMSGMDMGALQDMASQAEGMLSKSGIDPSAIMGLMG